MKRTLLPILAASLGLGIGVPAAPVDPLSDGFATPLQDAHPETFFHLIGGNVSKPGLTVDLESVAHAGFKGILLFHGISDFGAWPGVSPQIECLSPS